MEKRSILLRGRATGVRLESEFWEVIKEIARAERKTVAALVEQIDQGRQCKLGPAIRLYVVNALRESAGRPAFRETAPQAPRIDGAGP
jgi:predicted DNA-binding ribbon-helix-helix protein